MRLLARIIEGMNSETFVVEEEFTQERFNYLYFLGLCLWNQDAISKYEIAVFDDSDKLIWNYRPDKSNFEKNDYEHEFIVSVLHQSNLIKQSNQGLLKSYLNDHHALWEKALELRNRQIEDESMKGFDR